MKPSADEMITMWKEVTLNVRPENSVVAQRSPEHLAAYQKMAVDAAAALSRGGVAFVIPE